MKECKDKLATRIPDTLKESHIAKIFKEMLIIGSIVAVVLSIVSGIVLYRNRLKI